MSGNGHTGSLMVADKQQFQHKVSIGTFTQWRGGIASAMVSWDGHGHDFIVSSDAMVLLED